MFQNILQLVSGSLHKLTNRTEFNSDRLTIFGSHPGLHFSRKNLAHSLQLHLANKFQKFDAGKEGNMRSYGQQKPPHYPLENISNRFIAFILCQNDTFVKLRDVTKLRRTLTGESKANNWYHICFKCSTLFQCLCMTTT